MTKAASLHTISGTSYTQTYSTTATTVEEATAAAVATTGATSSTPYGFSEEQANAIVTNLNAVIADVLQLRKVLNAVIDDLQSAGLVD